MGARKATTEVKALVMAEMARTDANNLLPTREDYLADLVRYLNNQLPRRHQFFAGDYAIDDGE